VRQVEWRQLHRSDQLAGRQFGFDVWRVAWQTMKVGEGNGPLAVRTGDLNGRVECGERDAHV
jgi:hypothetical protein